MLIIFYFQDEFMQWHLWHGSITVYMQYKYIVGYTNGDI